MNNFFKNSSIIIFIVVGVCGYFFYLNIQKQKRQAIELHQVINGCLFVLDKSSQETNILDDYIKRESFIRESVGQYLKLNHDLEFDNSKTAIDLCPRIAESWIRYEKPLVSMLKEFNSTRMYDRKTFKDESELQWRANALDVLLELSDKLKNASQYTKDVLFEEISKSDVNDLIKEQYYSNIRNLFIKDLSPPAVVNYRLTVKSLKQYFTFIFENKDAFEIENDQIVFKSEAVMREHNKIYNVMQEHASSLQENLERFK